MNGNTFLYELHAWKGSEKTVIDILEDQFMAEAKMLEYRELYPNYSWNVHWVSVKDEPTELDYEDDGA
jgi:hypothetical protein